jgi:hypothetical protein
MPVQQVSFTKMSIPATASTRLHICDDDSIDGSIALRSLNVLLSLAGSGESNTQAGGRRLGAQ